MTIDRASYEPVHRQLARILGDRIQSGEFRPGDQLPAEATLAQTYEVGRDAVRDTLALLRNDGLVVTERGQGTFVRKPATDITVVPAGAGARVAARVATADERLQLGMPEGTAVLVLTRAGEPEEVLPGDRTVVEFGNGLRRLWEEP